VPLHLLSGVGEGIFQIARCPAVPSADFFIRSGLPKYSVIEDEEVIKRILKHLGLWEVNPPE
jgi:hypothetical protein